MREGVALDNVRRSPVPILTERLVDCPHAAALVFVDRVSTEPIPRAVLAARTIKGNLDRAPGVCFAH
jgi:hypothetical protein